MRAAHLTFLSLAVAALCAPSGGTGGIGGIVFGHSGSISALGYMTAAVVEVDGDIAEELEAAFDVVSQRSDEAAADGDPSASTSTISAPPEPTLPAASPSPPDANSTSIMSENQNHVSHVLKTAGHALDLIEAVFNLLTHDIQEAESHSGAEEPEGGPVTRRTDLSSNGTRYRRDTPTARELYLRSLHAFGHSLDDVDRAIASAHDTITRARATPLVASDPTPQVTISEIIDVMEAGPNVVIGSVDQLCA